MARRVSDRCPRPCSLCGRLDIPVTAREIAWKVAEPGGTNPVCYGGFKSPCSGKIHPCRDCVVYAPKPWPKDYRVGEVVYEGRLLGRIPVPGKDDSKDPEGTMGHIGRVVLFDLLDRNELPDGMAPQEWILWVLRGIGVAMSGGKRNQVLEDQIMRRHLRHYGALGGMDNLIKAARSVS